MSAKTATLRNAVDAWVEQNKPSKSHAADATLQVADGEAIPYIYFAFPAPRGATITSATLKLYTRGSFGGASPTITVQRVSARYSASKVNWNNKPGATGPTVAVSQASSGDGDEWAFNVAPLLQPIADGAAWYGFRVTVGTSTVRKFRSGNAGNKQPTLTVTWSEAPDRPTRLSPSGGQAVNAAKPVVEMDYTDTSGSTTLASLQVQVDASPTGFATPDFDSGTVAATGSKARLDLATTAYAGLAEGGTAYWRGRVRDAAGLWSEWSAVASWTRTAKGVITITSPSVGTPELEDFTPPVVWTFSLVSEKWRVIVEDSNGTEVFDSGETLGAETECTIDAGDGSALLDPGETYTVEVRVWDDTDRIGTVDDPAYSVARQEFTVVPSAGVDPVTDVETESVAPLPALLVRWSRADAPDGFTILRDGKVIAANIEPSDVLEAGTTYSITLANMRPNVSNTISISAIVNGVASVPVEIEAVARVSGIWLVDRDNPALCLMLAKTSGSSLVLGEDGETIVPLGSTEGIRITQGLRGYEGTISGVIIGEAGKTRDEWVENALAMRASPGRIYRLVVGTEVFDVVIGNLTVRPTGDSAPGMRPVSFDFWQVGRARVPVVL